MPVNQATKELVDEIAPLLHARKRGSAAQRLVTFYNVKTADGHRLKIGGKDSDAKTLPIITAFLHNLMEQGADGMSCAARLLWTPTLFTPEPASVKAVWNLFDTANRGLIMGAARLGKSFSMGVRLFLEWVRDPEYTTIRVLGPSEDHLEQNLFSHIVGLHKAASLPMPGEIGELFIGLDRREQLSSIKGVIIPKGNSKKAGRLQGGHRRPRKQPHPRFGNLSRMFIFLDEIENIPNGVWLDIDNVLSEIEKGSQGFAIYGAYNPTNPYDEVGKRAEPVFGWGELDADTHFNWVSKRGWTVLRLDGERCENVVRGEIVFPGLQTRDGLEAIAQGSGGRNSPGYLTMGRGMYPPVGVAATVIPAGMIPKLRGEFIWYDPPQPCVGVDLALEGGDEAVYTLGKWGRTSGVKYPPSLEFPNGRTVMFKDPRNNAITPRWGLEVTHQFVLPKAESVAMKNSILDMNRKAGVRPEFFACDRTGHGAGVADLLKYEWSTAIWDVNYTESAGEEKLMAEDSKSCKEMYERMYSVLWFATRQWSEFGYLLFNPALDLSKLTPQLTQRETRTIGGRSKVESKTDYKSRGNSSPNDADSLTLLVHAARKGSGLSLSRRGENVELPGQSPWSDWPGEHYEGGARIDPTNRTDFLDERSVPVDPYGMSIL
jgi:hypothetical protein